MVVASAAMCGVVMFAYYNNCDPLKAGKIATPDMVRKTHDTERKLSRALSRLTTVCSEDTGVEVIAAIMHFSCKNYDHVMKSQGDTNSTHGDWVYDQ